MLPQSSPPTVAQSVAAADLLALLAAAKITHVVCVPDSHQRSLLTALAADPRFTLLTVATEDEALGVAAGLYFGGIWPAVSLQHSGLYACVNTLRGLGLDAAVPMILLVGLLGRAADQPPERSTSSLNRLVRPLLDALGVRHLLLDQVDQLTMAAQAIATAQRARQPFAILLGQPTA